MAAQTDYDLIRSVKRLHTLLAQNIDSLLQEHGLARTQYRVLYHAKTSGGVPGKQLLEQLQVEPATLSGIIDTLEAKGLVERREQPDDKRRKNIVLTAAGRKLLAKIPPPGPVIEQAMLAGLNKKDAAELARINERIIGNLETNLRQLNQSRSGQ